MECRSVVERPAPHQPFPQLNALKRKNSKLIEEDEPLEKKETFGSDRGRKECREQSICQDSKLLSAPRNRYSILYEVSKLIQSLFVETNFIKAVGTAAETGLSLSEVSTEKSKYSSSVMTHSRRNALKDITKMVSTGFKNFANALVAFLTCLWNAASSLRSFNCARTSVKPLGSTYARNSPTHFCGLPDLGIICGFGALLSVLPRGTHANLSTNLIASYPFNGNALDVSGNGHNGSVHSAFLSADRFGNVNCAYGFNGSTSYIEILNGTAFNFVDDFSISLWINPASSQASIATIISKSHSPGGWDIEQNTAPTNNAWNHFAIIKEDLTTHIYLNNILATSFNGTNAYLISNENLPLTIGAWNSGHTHPASNLERFFTGLLDDIRIYDRALSPAEVSQLYTVESPSPREPAFAVYSGNAKELIFPLTAVPDPDGSDFYFGGYVNPSGTSNSNSLLGKFNAQGQGEWFNEQNSTLFSQIEIFSTTIMNKALYVGGGVIPTGSGSWEPYIGMYNRINGTLMSAWVLSGLGSNAYITVIKGKGNNNILTCFGVDKGAENPFVLRFNPNNGTVTDSANIKTPEYAVIQSAVKMDSSYVIGGYINSSPPLGWISKVHYNGTVWNSTWTRFYSTGGGAEITSLAIKNNTIIFAGNAWGWGVIGEINVITPANDWVLSIGGGGKDSYLNGIVFNGLNSSTDIMAVGATSAGAIHSVHAAWYVLMNLNTRSLIKSVLLDGTENNIAQTVIANKDGTFTSFGTTKSYGSSMQNFLFVTLNENAWLDAAMLPSAIIYHDNPRNITLGAQSIRTTLGKITFSRLILTVTSISSELRTLRNEILPVWQKVATATFSPTSQPSSQPTDQPSCDPTERPTSNPTGHPTLSPSEQPTTTPSSLPSSNPSNKPTNQPTSRPTIQPSKQPTSQPTARPSAEPTSQPSVLPTCRPTLSPTSQPTSSPTTEPTREPSTQPSGQPTSQPGGRPSAQPSSIPTGQPSVDPSTQPTGRPSTQPTNVPSGQPSRTPSSQPSGHPSTQPTIQPSKQPTATPSAEPMSQPSVLPTCRPTLSPTSQPTSSPTTQPTREPSTQPSGQPTSQPGGRPSAQPSADPSTQPTGQPSTQPNSKPTDQPTSQPTSQPTVRPSAEPTSQPSVLPTCRPTLSPTSQPTSSPTTEPTREPSTQPSGQPTSQPGGRPSAQPSSIPTGQPSVDPRTQPTGRPSTQPTNVPSGQPSRTPSSQPSGHPSTQPTIQPSNQPTNQPILQPTSQPSKQPTVEPSAEPTRQPTVQPTNQPSSHPSTCPSVQPTMIPSSQPSNQPTTIPTGQPSQQPKSQPTLEPSSVPTVPPSSQPTNRPSMAPSKQPTSKPSSVPTTEPIGQPTSLPTVQPSAEPTQKPTDQPTAQPTSVPTTPPVAQPSHYPTSMPTIYPSGQPSLQPSSQPTFGPSGQPTLNPTVSPTVSPTAYPTTKKTSPSLGWLALLGPQSPVNKIGFLKNHQILLTSRAAAFVVNTTDGALLGYYNVPWNTTKALLINSFPYNNINIVGSSNPNFSSIASCELKSNQLRCNYLLYSEINFENAIFHSYYDTAMALGRDLLNQTIATFFSPPQFHLVFQLLSSSLLPR